MDQRYGDFFAVAGIGARCLLNYCTSFTPRLGLFTFGFIGHLHDGDRSRALSRHRHHMRVLLGQRQRSSHWLAESRAERRADGGLIFSNQAKIGLMLQQHGIYRAYHDAADGAQALGADLVEGICRRVPVVI